VSSGGDVWNTQDVLSRDRLNQKTIVVRSTAPPSGYIFVGQLWFDTSENKYKFSKDGSTFTRLIKYLVATDDTRLSVNGTTETEIKNFRFAKTSYTPYSNFHIIASIWVSGGTGYIKIYVDNETTARLTLSSTSTSETLVEGDFSIGDLANGIHTIHIKLVNSGAYYTYNELIEVWGE
jgi:hypothetical protein